ncbi:MAG: hypothetical protein GEU95_27855 [Rhizobiales bacterium]|nr:hypothetical protein [Hyphomicrobiales bacterium]
MIKRSATLDAILRELEAAGVKPTVVQNGHLKVRWQCGGKERSVTTSVSPSDWRAPRKARSFVRRMLRQDGVLR